MAINIKRKNIETGICPICKKENRLRFQLTRNPKSKSFICKKCRPYIAI